MPAIEGRVALVTGANRGLGKALCDALLEGGAARVYAGARDPASVNDLRVVPVALDVTDGDRVAAAAARCVDVDLLVNNAGIMLETPLLAVDSERALRDELEVNVFGTLAMIRAFAPVLRRNGGGAIVDVLSVTSLFVNRDNATYCTSKHAALAVTDAARIELADQGTRVIGVYAGYIDTEMAAGVDRPKSTPQDVAARILAGICADADHVLADDRARTHWLKFRAGIPAFGA